MNILNKTVTVSEHQTASNNFVPMLGQFYYKMFMLKLNLLLALHCPAT